MWLNSDKIFLSVPVLILLATVCQGSDEVLHRQRRVLAYPYNSCTGVSDLSVGGKKDYIALIVTLIHLQVLVAISVPLGLEHRNVFVSYNFEANYNMPTSAPDLVPGPLKRLDLVDKDRSFKASGKNATNAVTIPEPPTFISRSKIYNLIESKING